MGGSQRGAFSVALAAVAEVSPSVFFVVSRRALRRFSISLGIPPFSCYILPGVCAACRVLSRPLGIPASRARQRARHIGGDQVLAHPVANFDVSSMKPMMNLCVGPSLCMSIVGRVWWLPMLAIRAWSRRGLRSEARSGGRPEIRRRWEPSETPNFVPWAHSSMRHLEPHPLRPSECDVDVGPRRSRSPERLQGTVSVVAHGIAASSVDHLSYHEYLLCMCV